MQNSQPMLNSQPILYREAIAGCDSLKSLMTFAERKAMDGFSLGLWVEH